MFRFSSGHLQVVLHETITYKTRIFKLTNIFGIVGIIKCRVVVCEELICVVKITVFTLLPNNIHNRQTSIFPARFEPAIPVIEQPQTDTLDRATTGDRL